MSEVTMRYFIGEGARAEQVAKEGMAKVNEAIERRRIFIEEIGAAGLMQRGKSAPYAVVFDSPTADEKPGFLSPSRVHDEGKAMYSYRPDRRTTTGKELAKRLDDLPDFDFSNFVVKAFGVSRSAIGANAESRTGQAMYVSVAGFIGKTLIFKIPFGGYSGNNGKDGVDIPADLREIKFSEFIALTEEQQAVAA